FPHRMRAAGGRTGGDRGTAGSGAGSDLPGAEAVAAPSGALRPVPAGAGGLTGGQPHSRCQTEIVARLSSVYGEPSQSATRRTSRIPAIRAIRSISAGQA